VQAAGTGWSPIVITVPYVGTATASNTSLTITLKAGEYKVYCPIGSHEVKGMTRKLTVTAPAAGAHGG